MDGYRRVDHSQAAHGHDAGQADAGPGGELARLRQAAIAAYEREGLASSDLAAANAAWMNADLMRYAAEIRELSESAFALATEDREELKNLLPLLDMGLRVYRTSERFMTFIDRLARRVQTEPGAAAVRPEAADRCGEAVADQNRGSGWGLPSEEIAS